MREMHSLHPSESLAAQMLRVSEQLEAVAEKLEDYEAFLNMHNDRKIKIKDWTNGTAMDLDFNPEAGP